MNSAANICKAIITRASILAHCKLTPDELIDARQGMVDTLTAADRVKIPWKLQNQLIYIGEHYDVRSWYLSELLQMACDRAGIEEVIP